MIKREYGRQTLYCDAGCGELHRFDSFDEALDFKKQNGWKTVKDRKTGEYIDTCPECQKEEF